ncbi:MAG: C cytochrome precursor, partial [Thermoanaerobaculia bacterium]
FADATALTAHTRHLPGSTGSQCYNCHMPFTSYGLLKALRSHQVDSPSVAVSLETGRPNACNQCHLDKTLAWSAENLEDWYGLPAPVLGDVERGVPASVIWLLSGDAGQRALMAWSLGWEPARQASGSHWMAPFLTQLLVDPYDAVRIIAGRSLSTQPGFEDFDYDATAAPGELIEAAQRARGVWAALPPPADQAADAWALLYDPQGVLPEDVFVDLLARRDDRVVILAE